MGILLSDYLLNLFCLIDITNPSVNVIFILIAVSLLVATGFLVSFIWSIKAGQFDDEYTPSVRILFDDEKNVIEEEKEVKGQRSKVAEVMTQDLKPKTLDQ